MPTTSLSSAQGAAHRMPTWFVPHGGGPCFFMDWNPPHAWNRMGDFLKGLAATLPQRPKAILMVSAHWLYNKVMKVPLRGKPFSNKPTF